MVSAMSRLGTAAHRVADAPKPLVRWGSFHGVSRLAVRHAASRGDLQSRLILAGAVRHTSQLLGQIDEIRDAGPVVQGRFAWITASHEQVKQVLSSGDFRTGFEISDNPVLSRLMLWSSDDTLHPVQPPSLLVTEPPDHTRYRRLVSRVFTARAVEGLRPRVEQVADALLDDLDPAAPVDLVSRYCALLPVAIITEILGVPAHDRARVLRLGTAAAASLDMGLSWRQFRTVEKALAEFDDWLTGHLRTLRDHPGDNLMSRLVQASDDGEHLDERELKATAGLVLAAGFETTVNLLGNGIRLLDAHPDQRRWLGAEPSGWAHAVDEVLRVDPPVLLTGRTATADTEVAGVPIGRGDLVTTLLAGANHDPAVFDDPHSFDVSRSNAREHVAFSAGRHYCLGAALARLEGEVGLRHLYARFPHVRLLPGEQRRETRILRGFRHLPAALR